MRPMRKLKQASQREKARKALKQSRDGPAETARPGPRATKNSDEPKHNGKSGPSGKLCHGGEPPAALRGKPLHH